MKFKEYLIENNKQWKTLLKNRMPLDSDERDKVMAAKAVWHHGPHGEATPAVWKSKDASGMIKYIYNTHRACQIKTTLSAAIKAYDFIKTTA